MRTIHEYELDSIVDEYNIAGDNLEFTKQKEMFIGVVELAKELADDVQTKKDEIDELDAQISTLESQTGGGYYAMRDCMLENFDGSLGDRLILEEMFKEFETKVGMNH